MACCVRNGCVWRGREEGVLGQKPFGRNDVSSLWPSASAVPPYAAPVRLRRVVWGMAGCHGVRRREFWVSHGCGPPCRSCLRMQHRRGRGVLCGDWPGVTGSGGGSLGCLMAAVLRVGHASVCSTDEVVVWRVGNGRVSRGPEEGVLVSHGYGPPRRSRLCLSKH